jgi:hypothetical protein
MTSELVSEQNPSTSKPATTVHRFEHAFTRRERKTEPPGGLD